MAAPDSANKRSLVEELLGETPIVCVYFDGRNPEVRVPSVCKKEPCTFFDLGLNLPRPIPDLRLDESGLFALLSFSGTPFHCFVPWGRVFAVTDKASGRGVVWKDHLPPEMLVRLEQVTSPVPAPVERQSHLRLIR